MDRVRAFFGDSPTFFNTITMQADDHTNIMHHWKKLTDTLRYYYPHLLIFWVKEYTQKGTAHLHFISSQSLDGAWLSRAWLQITGTSYVVKCGNSSFEIKNAAGYMLKYMTKAHAALDMYDKGERIYGFLGAKAPAIAKMGYEEEVLEFTLEQHYNTGSKHWEKWYNEKQQQIGPAFISYMDYLTLSPGRRIQVEEQKLNFESPTVEPIFTRVEHHDGSTNRERWEQWKKDFANEPGRIPGTAQQLPVHDTIPQFPNTKKRV